MILRSTATLIRVITPAVLSIYLDKSCKSLFLSPETGIELYEAALSGLRSALDVPDPPEAVSSLLFTTVLDIFVALKGEKNVSTLRNLRFCVYLIHLMYSDLLYPPQTLFVGGILFSRCPCVRPSVRP